MAKLFIFAKAKVRIFFQKNDLKAPFIEKNWLSENIYSFSISSIVKLVFCRMTSVGLSAFFRV
jgi:hypothetical protein